jgi:hypothetical protein
MQPRPRTLLAILFLVAILTVSFLVFVRNCPSSGIALTPRARYLHRLKNRTSIPATTDFDSRVTLEAMLQPGDDRERWSNDRAARIQGEVIDVAYARPEATNCFSPCRRDIHILVATHKGAAQSEQVVVEVTPNFQSESCSEETLPKQLVGHWCEFEGWMYFDAGHAEESENISPGKPDNWRATAWEIHPVTKFRVIR